MQFDLESTRERADAFAGEVTEATYRARAGLAEASEVAIVRARYLDLADPGLAGHLGTLLEGEGPTVEERLRLRYLQRFVTLNHLGAARREQGDHVLDAESSKVIDVDGEAVPYRSLTIRIANEVDRARRRGLEAAGLAFLRETNPRREEVWEATYGAARAFGDAGYRACCERILDVDLPGLWGVMEEFLVRTNDVYFEVMRWFSRKRLGLALADVRRADLTHLFRAPEFDDAFPVARMTRVVADTFRDLGLDPTADGRLVLDIESRPRKVSRAFCAPVEVPGRVYLVIHPRGGHLDYQSYLHEMGHAMHAACSSARLPVEFRRFGDPAVGETHAFTLQYLVLDAGWLARHLEFHRPKDFLRLAWVRYLYTLRRYAAKLRYELELHEIRESEERAALYQRSLALALGFEHPVEAYLDDLDPEFYTAAYLRAWLFHGMLRRHLTHFFEMDWYRNPRAGRFLRGLWGLGQRYDVQALVGHLGYAGVDVSTIVDTIERNL